MIPPSGTTIITLDQTKSSPYEMLSGEFGKDGDPKKNVISWIRANSHRYVGTYNATDGMLLRQLDDADSSHYADSGNMAFTPGVAESVDVFMKMPDFWFKGVPLLDRNKNGDIVEMHFTAIDPHDSSWTKWDGNKLIGVYQVSLSSDLIMYSRPYAGRLFNCTKIQLTNYARSRGYNQSIDEGFSLISYEAHQVMALLYMAYYGNTNSCVQCGYRLPNTNSLTGSSVYIGMTDTTNGMVSPTVSANFWGLEEWWGTPEIMGNLESVEGDFLLYHSIKQAGSIRYMNAVENNGGLYQSIKTLALGEHLDVTPKENDYRRDNLYYASTCIMYDDFDGDNKGYGCITRGKLGSSGEPPGIFALHCVFSTAEYGGSTITSRLQYKGRCKIVTNAV